MQKTLITRYIIHKTLKNLKNNNSSFDILFQKINNTYKLELRDKKFIHNVVLNTMRNHLAVKKIILNYTNKIKEDGDGYFLLLSSITQIVFLKFKDHGVVNSTVELAKSKKLHVSHSFINGVLRNIARDKAQLSKINLSYNDLPYWFIKNTKKWNGIQKNNFIKTIRTEPHIHIVFKDPKLLEKSKWNNCILTSKNSLSLSNLENIENLPDYKKGIWWVQDFSAMMPLHLLGNLKNKKVLDMCAAPGGKAFQALSKNAKLDVYEVNALKANILNDNFNRLNYLQKINIGNSLNILNDKTYDVVLIDAPCSAIGTIRKNPEIFFRKKNLDLSKVCRIQSNLLDKARNMVKKNGIIIYMVCSFFEQECEDQIYNFLKNNKNFKIKKYIPDKNLNNIITNKGYIKILPNEYKNSFKVDGFFSAILINND